MTSDIKFAYFEVSNIDRYNRKLLESITLRDNSDYNSSYSYNIISRNYYIELSLRNDSLK